MKKESVFLKNESDLDRTGRFIAGSSILFLVSAMSGVFQFAWTVIMSRLVGPEGYGFVGPFLNVFWILSQAATLGVPFAMMAFIAGETGVDGGKEEAAGGTKLLAMLGIAFCLPLAGVALWYGSEGRWLMCGLAGAMTVAIGGRQMYYAAFAVLGGRQRMDLVAVANIVFPAVMLAVSIVFVIVAGAGATRRVVAGVGGIGVAVWAQFFVSVALLPRGGVAVSDVFRWRIAGSGTVYRRLLTFGWVSAVATIAGSAMSFSASAVVSMAAHSLGYFGVDEAVRARQAGYFSGAFTYAMGPMLIVGMIVALLPAISEAQAAGNKKLIQRYFALAVKYGVCIDAYIVAVFAVHGGRLVRLFSGDKYPEGLMWWLTAVLAAGMSMAMVFLLLSNLLIGAKRPGIPAWVSVVTLAAEGVALLGVGAMGYGIKVAALVFDGVMLAGVAVLFVTVVKRLGLKMVWGEIIKPCAAAAVAAGALLVLPSDGFLFLLSILVSAPVFFVAFCLLGGLGAGDFDVLGGMAGEGGGGVSRIITVVRKLSALSPFSRKDIQ